MKTSTIYRAFRETYRRALLSQSDFRIRQWKTFEAELLRRMDERDTWDALRKTRRPKTFADAGMTTMTIYGKWDI